MHITHTLITFLKPVWNLGWVADHKDEARETRTSRRIRREGDRSRQTGSKSKGKNEAQVKKCRCLKVKLIVNRPNAR